MEIRSAQEASRSRCLRINVMCVCVLDEPEQAENREAPESKRSRS